MIRSMICKMTQSIPRSLTIVPSNQYCSSNTGTDTTNTGTTREVNAVEKSINRVSLLGRVGGDPEERGSLEVPTVTISLATNSNFRKDDEFIQKTEWHRIVVFKPFLRDSVLNYVKKGSRILVEGRLSYIERKDLNNPALIVKSASVVADEIIFLTK